MEKIYQTIIIGAGPAGLIVGKYLEDALILDKKQEIGRPVQCGEGISKKVLEMQGIKPDFSWISCKLHKIERIMPDSKAKRIKNDRIKIKNLNYLTTKLLCYYDKNDN